jgi:glucose uptake protein
MTSKWRFELYCFDFAVGAVLAALLIGFTFGNLGWDGFALMDDLGIAGKRNEAFGLGAGMVFSLGNMLILGALSVAGVTVAYLTGLGVMLTTGMVITYFTSPSGSVSMLVAGACLVVASSVLLAISIRMQSLARLVAQMREGKTKSTRKTVSMKGPILAVSGGIVAGICFPLINAARDSEAGVGPYSLGLLFAVGVAIGTVVFSLFFMNLPIQGEAIELTAYFDGRPKSHWLGVLGGMLFYVGLASMLIVARAEGANIVKPATVRALTLAAAVVGALWGLLRWKEFEGAEGRVRTLLMIALFVFAVGAISLAAAAGLSTAG